MLDFEPVVRTHLLTMCFIHTLTIMWQSSGYTLVMRVK